MFSTAVSVGTRLKAWKMKPILSRRSMVSCLSLSVERSVSPMKTVPDGERVEPGEAVHQRATCPSRDGPMMAVNSPAAKSTVTPSRAVHGGVAVAVDLGGLLRRWRPRCAQRERSWVVMVAVMT